MKKHLLLCIAIGLLSTCFAQNQRFKKMSYKLPDQTMLEPIARKTKPITKAIQKQKPETFQASAYDLSFIEIGQSGNAYGFSGNGRTCLWVDDELNSVVFTHRMTDDSAFGTGRIAYDLSSNSGVAGSWANNIQVYDDPDIPYYDGAGRYPQGGIINPFSTPTSKMPITPILSQPST
jgi:hypothetical protein